jgi:hypothetical protein
MHPYLLSQLSQEHIADLHREAARRRPARVPAARRGDSIRTRAGWTLVHIGLRLAERSANG